MTTTDYTHLAPVAEALANTILVMGKGGVGKSTVARGIAYTLAQRGLRTAVLELGVQTPASVTPDAGGASITHLSISEEAALLETACEIFASPRVAKLMLGNFAVKQLVSVVPGMREYCLLVAARARLAAYDRIVIDMPATGHGVRWLSVGAQLARLVPRGAARTQAEALDAALRSPRETSYVLVTLPEPMVLAESAQLEHGLHTRLGRQVAHTVVNRVPAAAEPREGDVHALRQADATLAAPLEELLAWTRDRSAALARAHLLMRSGGATLVSDGSSPPTLHALEDALAVSLGGAT